MIRYNRTTRMLLIAALFVALLTISIPGTTLWRRVLMDAGHGIVFAGMAALLLFDRPGTVRSSGHSRVEFLQAFGAATILGVAAELLQLLQPQRDASAMDVMHDMAGAALALAMIALFERRKDEQGHDLARGRSVLVGSLALVALLALALDPVKCAWAYLERGRSFPTILPMGNVADGAFAVARHAGMEIGPLPPQWRLNGDSHAVRLEFAPGTDPALEIVEPAPDWRGHLWLYLDITNPSDAPLVMTLRIHDAHHNWEYRDRLNLPITVAAATRTTLRIPLQSVADAPANRRMDMAAIANVMLFASVPVKASAIYVSRIWLN